MKNLPSIDFNRLWVIKFKAHHAVFWAFYHLAWGIAEFGIRALVGMFDQPQSFIMFWCFVMLHTLAVNFNIYFLLPKYLEKGKLTQYIVYVSGWIVFTSLTLLTCFFVTAQILNMSMSEFCGITEVSLSSLFHFYVVRVFPATAGAMMLGMSLKLAKNWSQAKKRQQKLEKEKLETELKFLKYQFNPHFLFNTINSIFFLIHKDPTMASAALAKFSELLRYQLYECNETQIPLSNEIAYLENFMALEKLRKNDNFKVSFEVDQQNKGHLGIASFILMTFVENAFKHVSKHKKMPNWVDIKLYFDGDQRLNFEVINSKSQVDVAVKEAVKYGGIGLKNVRRRLDLIYPDQHDLIIEDLGTTFRVKLQLDLIELAAPPMGQEFLTEVKR
ncbi:MAG TPA: sensor histidine kinase [Microscillaceae bacterium]|nr:sensor histidine kinase [Microscillaceae bacterium]